MSAADAPRPPPVAAPLPRDDESLLAPLLCSAHRAFVPTTIYDAAAWYDVDYAAYQAELPFYRQLLAQHVAPSQTFVELGAGTGRLTLPLLQTEPMVRAWGVEPAPAMRARLQQKANEQGLWDRLGVEDATAATFAGPVDPAPLVIFPFNGLLHVETRAALALAFAHVKSRLAPTGRFALDMTGPYWESILAGRVGWGRVDERVHPASGRPYLTCDRSTYQPATRTMRIDIRFAYADAPNEPGVEVLLVQRMWTYQEIFAALEDAGFVVCEAYGDVDLTPFLEGSARLLLSARPA